MKTFSNVFSCFLRIIKKIRTSTILFFISKIEYLVKWLGYERKDSTWEPLVNLNCDEKLREFQKKHAHEINGKIEKKTFNRNNRPTRNITSLIF